MQKLSKVLVVLGGLGAVTTSFTGLSVMANPWEDSAPVERVVVCLRAANAAQPGRVKEVEIEQDDRLRICKVKMYRNGRDYEVKVNLINGRVLRVERD